MATNLPAHEAEVRYVDSASDSGNVTPIREKADLSHIEKAERDAISSDVPFIDPEKQRKLVRKIDLHVLPLVMLLYLNSFIDRVNIGNARLYGLERDLGMQGNQFQIAVSILFVTYVIFELPLDLVMKKYVRPSRWIASITMGWGLVATFSGFTQSYAGLIVCRLLLGATEAGLFPGMVVYLTFFYTKNELALRTAYLFVSAAIVGSIGGLLAYGIGFMDGLGTQIMLGNIASTVAPFLYPTEDRPRFTMGHATNLSLVALGVLIFTFFHLYLSWENRQRRLGKRDHKMEGKTEEEILAMGDKNPRFMYTT